MQTANFIHPGKTFAILDSDDTTYQGIDSLVGANEILLDAGTSTDRRAVLVEAIDEELMAALARWEELGAR